MSHVLLILISLIALVGCQVKEESGSGQLIAGHTPATNSFTVSAPSNGTYKAGDILNFTLSFPYNVVVSGGTPSLSLTIGASTISAPLVSGAGTKSLIFRYTILASENDVDGITLNSLNLNGSTMTFTNSAGVSTNCDIATVTTRNYTNIFVDNTGPTLTAFSLVTLPGFYNEGDQIVFSATYSEPVVVGTPVPSFNLTFNTAAVATYVSGSGTNTINFQYTITNTQFDYNGFTFPGPNTFTNGTSIKDVSGNAAAVDFSAFVAAIDGTGTGPTCTGGSSDCVEFDGRAPFITNIVPPNPRSYASAQNLDYVVEFNKNVTVTGSPYLALTIGSSTKQASYTSGSGSRFITFRYTTVPGDVDADGITSPTSITAGTGTIVSTTGGYNFFVSGTNGGSFSNNLFTAPDTSGVIVTATQPQPTAVIRGADTTNRIFPTAIADNVWIINQPLLITVEFNTGMYVGQTSGTPSIPITIGATTRQATYLSGGDGQTSLVFRYVIQEGDLDTDGNITLGDIELNGGTITDNANTNSLLTLPVTSISSTTIDGIRPTISNVTAPADGTYSTVTTPNNLWFTVNWSEAVNFNGVINLPLIIGATPVNAATIQAGNDSASVTLRTNALTGYNDLDGIAVSSPLTGAGTIRDQAGNTASVLTFAPPTTTGVLVDTTAPTVVSITPPANGTYTLGQNLDFVFNFSEDVTVSVAGGYPRIPFTVGATTRYLVPISNGTSSTHTFRYTIVAGEADTDGVAFSVGTAAINHTGGGYLRDAGLNNSVANFFGIVPNTTGVLVDSQAPTISSVVRPTNGTYRTGDTLQFIVNWSENVTYNGAGSNRIAVNLDSGTVYFDYSSGSGSSTFIYEYTIAGNDLDLDGITPNISTVTIGGGAVLEDASNNAATLTFTAQNLSSIFIVYTDMAVIANAPFTANRAYGATPSISQIGGTVVSNYKIFDGDDSISVLGTVSGIQHIFVAFRTDGTPANMPFISSFTYLEDDGGTGFNLKLNGATLQNIAAGAAVKIHIDTSASPETINAGDIITNAFLGRVAEIIVVNGPLNITQIAQIDNYLLLKYP